MPSSSFKPLSILLLLFALIAAWPAAGASPDAAKGAAFTVPVTGAGPGGSFDGTFTIDRFVPTSAGTVAAVGLLKGTVTDGATGAKSTVVKNVAWSVASGTQARAITQQATCDILNLVLGPLHLDLLGLVIDLNQVVLNITGETGAGNLLGNLLCAITGILDSPSLLDQLARLLNQLLGLLG